MSADCGIAGILVHAVVREKDLIVRLGMESSHQLRDIMVTNRCCPFAVHQFVS
jgi:hypothetical protein